MKIQTFNTLIKKLRRPATPVYQQLELPLGGVSLSREDSKIVLELRRIRESLARS
ncbi:MAG: hypothetical protein ACK5NG_08460 [Chthoniobacterales bacterium]